MAVVACQDRELPHCAETTDHDDGEIAERAIKVFELSQTLKSRWETAEYAAKRSILEILCEEGRLNSQSLEIRLKKPLIRSRPSSLCL
jgi:site-specific DNA recombinase